MGIFKHTTATAHSAADSLRRLRNHLRRHLTEEQEDLLLYRADPALMNALYFLSGSSHDYFGSFDDAKQADVESEEWLDLDVNDICVRVAALRKRLGLRAEPPL